MSIETQSHDPKRDITEKTPSEAVHDSVMGRDSEMGEMHPGVPAVWVFGTYPIVLLLVSVIAIGFYFFTSKNIPSDTKTNNSNVATQTTESGVRAPMESSSNDKR